MSEPMLTPADLAEQFGGDVTPRKILDWTKEHDWPCIHVGRTYRYTVEQFAEIKARHTVTGSKDDRADAPFAIEGQTARSARRSA